MAKILLTCVTLLLIIPNTFTQRLTVEDFSFSGPLGSADADISKIGKNHFRVILGHAPEKPDWSNMLQFTIHSNARGNDLRLNVEFPKEVERYKFNHYFNSWSYDRSDWHPVHWRTNPYAGSNTDVLVFPVFDRDTVYVGHQVPMSYEKLEELIARWEKDPLVRVHVVGKSIEGRNLYRLEVTEANTSNKKWGHYFANQHPGEHNAQWRMAGVLQWLLSDEGREYCRYNICHLVFLMSPDAPSHGWYRTNAEGIDMNRSYRAEGSDATLQAHEAFLIQKDLEALMRSAHPVHTIWSMHTWQGAVEPILTPGPEFDHTVGSKEDFREILLRNDTLSFIEPLKFRDPRENNTTYWTDGPHIQFGITAALVEGAGNIYTKDENIYTGEILMKSIAEFYAK